MARIMWKACGRFVLVLALLSAAFAPVFSEAAEPAPRPAASARESRDQGACKTGNQTLFYAPHPMLDARTLPGFSDSLRAQLVDPVRNLGYCIEEIRNYRTLLDTVKYGENLILQALVGENGDASTVSVALLRVREMARGRLTEAISRPLVSLRFENTELSSLPDILAKKIAENLRSQYVADLTIRSLPPGAYVRAPTGLDGRTPVEWVMPLGLVEITLEKRGYLPMRREIDLSAPGQHTYDLQLVKRRFYHSKFIYPALAAGVLSAAAFALEEYYYAQYLALDNADRLNRPHVFAEKFRTAKAYERLGYGALGLAGISLVLCFTF